MRAFECSKLCKKKKKTKKNKRNFALMVLCLGQALSRNHARRTNRNTIKVPNAHTQDWTGHNTKFKLIDFLCLLFILILKLVFGCSFPYLFIFHLCFIMPGYSRLFSALEQRKLLKYFQQDDHKSSFLAFI